MITLNLNLRPQSIEEGFIIYSYRFIDHMVTIMSRIDSFTHLQVFCSRMSVPSILVVMQIPVIPTDPSRVHSNCHGTWLLAFDNHIPHNTLLYLSIFWIEAGQT